MAQATGARRGTRSTAKVPVDKVPAELRGFYDDEPADDGPVRLTTGTAALVEREPLFYIDDKEYTIPKKFGPHLGLVYLRAAESDGRDIALGRVMKAALGPEGWDALCSCEDITSDQLTSIMGKVQDKVLGAVESTEGNG